MEGRAGIVEHKTAEGSEKDGAEGIEICTWILWAVWPAPGSSLTVAWACIAFTWIIT